MAEDGGKMEVGNLLKFLDIKKIKRVSLSTTAFMLAAYMYTYTNGSLLFDAAELYRGTIHVNFASDKWAISLRGILDACVNEPWLAGVWAILFMIVSVYLIVDILEIESIWGICLTAGLCSTQSSIICLQQYTGGQYVGEMALAFACLAAWIFLKTHINVMWKTGLTAGCIALSAGIYGAYISMVPSLMILSLIMDIIYKGKTAKETWKKAVWSAGQFLIGMILYYAILRIGLYFTGTQIQSYMGEDSLSSVQQVIAKHNYLVEAYEYLIRYYLGRLPFHFLPGSLRKMAFISLIMGVCISVISLIKNWKKIADFKYNMLLLAALLFVLPLSLNLIYVLASGNVHFLMIFTYVLPYVFAVKIMESEISNKEISMPGYLFSTGYKIALCVFIYYSVVMSNAMIVYLNNIYLRVQSIETRFLDRVESCEGFDGTEIIHLIGNMRYNEYFTDPVPKVEILDANLGMARADLSSGFDLLFLTNIMNSKLSYDHCGSVEEFAAELTEKGVDKDIIEQIETMPAFPYDGSVQKIEEDIYVIFSTDEMRNAYLDKYGS